MKTISLEFIPHVEGQIVCKRTDADGTARRDILYAAGGGPSVEDLSPENQAKWFAAVRIARG